MPEQLGFDLPGIAALGRADFLVAPSNAVAVAMIENWRTWSGRKLVLSGPEGAGKTHLTHVWSGLSGASIVSAATLTEAMIPDLAKGSVAVEDVPEIAGDPGAQTALFHLHNMILAEGHALLLTGRGEPGHWGLGLPDLASRISGTQSATLAPPDDALLAAVLAKLFADRQITPKPDVIPFLIRRIDRSFAAARDVVAVLDAASLAQKRPLTRMLAATVLDKGITRG
jgi:chromosomal replication initiation ATPase DnaA